MDWLRFLPRCLAALCFFASSALAYGPVPPGVPATDPYVVAGYLRVAPPYYAVDKTGQTDSTAGLRKALDDGYNYGLAVLLPAGTYLVSDTLRRDQVYGSSCSEVLRFTPTMISKSPILVGEPGAQRPLIKLKDGSPGFNDPNPAADDDHFKPVIHFRNDHESGWEGYPSCGFGLVFRGIDINLGSGNGSAVGIAIPSAQYSTIEDTKITATGAFAGILGVPTTTAIVNVEVEGGQYGIRPNTCCGVSLVGIKLRNQTEAGLLLNNFSAVMVTGFDIQVGGDAVPILNTNYIAQISEMALLDGVIRITGNGTQPAISNPNGHTVWASNVYVTSTGPVVQSGSHTVAGGGTKRIAEYSYTNARAQTSGSVPNNSYTLINGVTGQSPIVSVADSAAPTTDFVRRHVFGALPWFNSPGVADVGKPPYGAVGDGVTDSTAAIQAAINQSDYVYLPRGDYAISGTLTLRPNTHLFGTVGMRSRLFGPNWNPNGQFLPFIRTPNSATATTYLGDIRIILPGTQARSYLEGLDWQAGANSIVRQVYVGGAYEDCPEGTPTSTCYPSAARKLIRIQGNGGGRWYGLQLSQCCSRLYNAGLRGLYVSGTTEPLTLYGPNPEHEQSSPFVEISNASNVRILGVKQENLTWSIANSNNIMLAAHTANSANYPTLKIAGSQNVVVPVFTLFAEQGSASNFLLSETFNGTTATVAGNNRVSLFKRGSFNAGVFDNVGTVPPATGALAACARSRTVVADGNPSEWSGIPATVIPYTKAVSAGGGTPTSDADSSASFRVQWDSTNLYVLVEARDDAVVGTSTGVYNNDSVEVYLNGGNETGTTYDANDFQLSVDWQNRKGGVNSGSITFTSAAAVTAQGYTVEYSVPWTALTGAASAGRLIGFDVGVNDNDASDLVRDSQILWNSPGNAWQNPSEFGKVELKATSCP